MTCIPPEPKRKPKRTITDSVNEQYRQMGIRAGLQDAINLLGRMRVSYENQTIRDLSAPFVRAAMMELARMLKEHQPDR